MSERLLLDLDEPALTVATAGAKAARLARARAAGLPALPGVVVPTGAAATALRNGAAALATGGSGAARLQVADAPLDAALVTALRWAGNRLGPALVARSSTPLEADPTWAGAFASYLGIRPDDLPVAVRGCWASLYSGRALARFEAAGVRAEDVAMAVLVQPEVRPEAGGTARVEGDGRVVISAVSGSPAALLAGWEPGTDATVRPDGGIESERNTLPRPLLVEVARLARATGAALGDEPGGRAGHELIEWAWVDGRAVLLQSQLSPTAVTPAAPVTLPPELDVRDCLRVAHVVARHPGPLAAELVLPWAIPLAQPPRPAPCSLEAGPALARALALAAALTGQVWGSPQRASEALAALRALVPGAGSWLHAAVRIDPRDGDVVVGLLDGVGRALAASGSLRRAEDVWRLSRPRLEALVARPEALVARPEALEAAPGTGPGPWGPFLVAAVRGGGRMLTGAAAAPGVGAGPALVVEEPEVRPTQVGYVLVAERPLPSLAPLLWHAAGLVTAGGSPGAHLVEVARSLGVPAVTGCRLPGLAGGSVLLAVDGDGGSVAVAV